MRVVNHCTKVMSFLIRHTRGMRHSKLSIVLVIVVGAISGLSNTALVAVMNASISRNGAASGTLMWSFIALCILTPLSRYLASILLSYLNTEATCEIGIKLCRRILAAPLRQLEQIGPHRLHATIGDIGTVAGVVTALPGTVINLTILIGFLVYLCWLSETLLVGLIAILAVAIVVYQIPLIRARRCYRIAREKTDQWIKHYRALVEGSKELKLNARRTDAFYSTLLRPTAVEIARLNYRGAAFIAASQSLGQVMTFIPIGLLLFAAPALVGAHAEVVNGFVLAFLCMIGPLTGVMGIIQNVSMASVAVDKIESLGLPLVAATSPNRQPDTARSPQRLVLSGITHTYYNEEKEHDFTLGPIDLEFHPGEMVFLVGGNGSGKTTLAKVIAGLYAPERGCILVNGSAVTDETREAYRQNFAMLFSDFFLFENLLGLEQLPDLGVRASEYLTLLRLQHKVTVKDGALSTINLSYGQRKRLALLMAYLEDRPIYIFDEWASDQDPVFREVFYRELLPGLKGRGKTVLVISHDDRYYDIGDRIVRLDYGRVEYDTSSARQDEAVAGAASSFGQIPLAT